jgi:NAD(P)-dependent dehydrogenase (short-subunit alcohol dehydrogenase family)
LDNFFFDKNFIITGASSGLGKEVSLSLDSLGANLVLLGRNKTSLLRTKNLMKNNHKYIVCDFSKLNDTKKKIKEMFKDKKFHGLIHGAGNYMLSPLQLISEKEIADSVNTNLISPLLITKEFCKRNNYNNNASIIFVSSIAGIIGSSSLSIYSMTKSGQIGLARSLAVEMASKKIRVNSISPGLINSRISEVLRSNISSDSFENIKKKHLLGIGKYSDIVSSLLFLLSDKSNWITGSNMIVDGGYSIN